MLDVVPALLAVLGLGLVVWPFRWAAAGIASVTFAVTVATALTGADRSDASLMALSSALVGMVFVLVRQGAFGLACLVAAAAAASVAPELSAIQLIAFWALGPPVAAAGAV